MLPSVSKSFRIAGFLLFLCFLTYRSSLHNEFLLDDFAIYLTQPKGFENIGQALNFTDNAQLFYRPLSNLMRLTLVTLLPADAFYFHAVNILLFSIHVLLIFFSLQVLLKNVRMAFVASVLYAVHPINGVAGNYVTGQEIPFFAIWLDLSVLFLAYYLDHPRQKKFHVISILFFVFALLSQEVAISFVLIVMVILFQFKKDLSFRDALKKSVPYIAVAAIYVLSRKFLVAQTIERAVGYTQAMQVNIPVYLNSVFDLIGWYLKQLVFPSEVILAKTLPPQTSGFLLKIILISIVAAAGWIAVRRQWKGNLVLLGILWLASGFIPLFAVALMFSYNDFIVEPHWFFFSSIGFFIGLAFLMERLFLKAASAWQRALAGIFLVILVWGGFSVTQMYNQVWRTQKSYCRYWLSLAPNHYFPNFWLARSYFGERAFDKAEYHYKKAFTGKKNDWYVYAGLGDIEAERGDFQKTKSYYLEALKLNPQDSRLKNNIQWIDEEFVSDDRTQ